MKAVSSTERLESAEDAEPTVEYQHSLLDVLRAQYEQNKELRCTRVLYIGRMASDEQKEAVAEIHREFIESQRSSQEVTGALLFINKRLFYHLLEVDSLDRMKPLFAKMGAASSDNFFNHIDASSEHSASAKRKARPELATVTVKMCCVSEEITREFPIWSVREVNVGGGAQDGEDEANSKSKGNKGGADAASEEDDEDEVAEDEHSLSELLFDTIKAMIGIARQLCMKPDKDAAMKLFQSSQREIMSRFPPPDKIHFFLQSKLLFDLAQFMDFFFSPIDIKLESEHSWPIEPMINF